MFCCCELLDTELHCPICGRVNLDYTDDYEPEDEYEEEYKDEEDPY
jgi:uncharacterized Zn finger protein (UPF0148 family)